MKNNTLETTTLETGAQRTHKAAYAKPVLRVFGSVKELTRGQAGSGTDAAGKTKIPSDRDIKENLVQVGTHPLGIGLYLFDYKPEYREDIGHGRQFGVMADEVEAVMPEAVSVHSHGYKQVDYAMLGIRHTIQ